MRRGRLHLLTQIRREIEDIFLGMGYEVWDGAEVATVWENFDALTSDAGHPSRSQLDTFYLDDHTVLRTHTSPDQIRAMQQRTPPIYMVSPGRCYRRDTPDATHSPIFLQVECLAVDRGITLADLQGTVLQFFRTLFGQEREVRMRTSFFPFTEPSVEFDVTCFICGGQGCCDVQALGLDRDGRRGLGRPGRVPQRRPRPRGVAGLRVRLRDRADRHAPARPARPARVLGERPPRPGAVLMKVPVSWLREYVDFDLPVEELARQLVFTSCEVDRIVRRGVPAGDNLQHFVVGKVLEAGKHPNADKLQLTKVDVGDGEPRSIVCGAWNFGAGATVAVVVPGGVMPGGEFTIEKRKLRGEVSDGMILSERELELGQDHGGIMVLPDDLAAGDAARRTCCRSATTCSRSRRCYNRPDLTSVYGIAREVAALTGAKLNPMPGTEPGPTLDGDERVEITIEDLEACPRFIARVLRDVTIGESPAWLKARLMGAGMRPISNVVDITNYVMLALGSPLHAYDSETLAGGRIVVRRARPGEELVTLDGTHRALDPADLVIADAERPIGLAGVMGGENTEVSETTTSVVLETANFEPLTVLRSGERHHMRSESQTRWEKGVDYHAAPLAATYATQLLVELAGARWTGENEVEAEPPARPRIPTALRMRARCSGSSCRRDEQRERLGRLGFEVEDGLGR